MRYKLIVDTEDGRVTLHEGNYSDIMLFRHFLLRMNKVKKIIIQDQ